MIPVYVAYSPLVLDIAAACGAVPGASYDMMGFEKLVASGRELRFLDTVDWRNPDQKRWWSAFERMRPYAAVIPDITHPTDLFDRLTWCAQVRAAGCDGILVPKCDCIDAIPSDITLGYAVPTDHGTSHLPHVAFRGRRVHLLGGSPIAQTTHADALTAVGATVVSVDGNAFCKAAEFGAFYRYNGAIWITGKLKPEDNKVGYHASLTLSLHSKVEFWRRYGEPAVLTVGPATPAEISDVKSIAARASKELGFVNRAALSDAQRRGELYVVRANQGACGFCHFHLRRDGWVTVYEVCVHARWRGMGAGRLLIDAVRGVGPVGLKCPVDQAANDFYAHLGFQHGGTERGKRRRLNLWRIDRAPHVAPEAALTFTPEWGVPVNGVG